MTVASWLFEVKRWIKEDENAYRTLAAMSGGIAYVYDE